MEAAGIEGCILGRALYEGKIKVDEVINDHFIRLMEDRKTPAAAENAGEPNGSKPLASNGATPAVSEGSAGAVNLANDLARDPTDIAHAYVALIQGLAAAEASQRLGGSPGSVARRWEVAIRALLKGFAVESADV